MLSARPVAISAGDGEQLDLLDGAQQLPLRAERPSLQETRERLAAAVECGRMTRAEADELLELWGESSRSR